MLTYGCLSNFRNASLMDNLFFFCYFLMAGLPMVARHRMSPVSLIVSYGYSYWLFRFSIGVITAEIRVSSNTMICSGRYDNQCPCLGLGTIGCMHWSIWFSNVWHEWGRLHFRESTDATIRGVGAKAPWATQSSTIEPATEWKTKREAGRKEGKEREKVKMVIDDDHEIIMLGME